MTAIRTSIQTKILAALVAVFVSLMVATTWHTAVSERAMVAELAEQKALDTASAYFDGVNTMMLTGTTAQRDVLREKVMAHEDITETRIIRSDEIVKVFGPGNPEQKVRDDLDRRSLKGERIVLHAEGEEGRNVTVLSPIIASSDFRGTNCLTCHVVAEGTVLGATRVSYSLAALDAQIDRNLMVSSTLNIAMLIVAVVVMTLLLRYIVVKPVDAMRVTMQRIEANADLGHRLDTRSKDEIGGLANAINSMLERFSGSLREVLDTSTHLKAVAGQINEVSAKTTDAADQQRGETDMVATAITELESTALQVREGASSAADASVEADRTANEGADTTRAAIKGIHALVSEIERAAEVVEQLDRSTQGVGGVLDVIKSIAEQTNLLALNAAIEAARAGEKGRGFAVVADEVRTLATRSHESTQEIETIVEQLQHGAHDAVKAMTRAKVSAEQRRGQVESADSGLNLIAEHVARIRELNAQMASAAHEQSAVTQDVTRNVVNISQLAERTAIGAEETTAVSKRLMQLSDQLESLVQSFRL
jgi:methyl-accepting chemotaxis protein